jgi:DNA-binding MarR family transcriptional regulator
MPSASPKTSTETAIEGLVRQLYGLGAVRRTIGRHGMAQLGSQGFTALAAVHLHGPLRVSDIAEHLGVDLSVASRQIAALAAEGYVERHTDARDRRAQLVACTDAGRTALTEAHRRMVGAFGQALGDWTPDEVDSLTHGLERLRGAFSPTSSPDSPKDSAR